MLLNVHVHVRGRWRNNWLHILAWSMWISQFRGRRRHWIFERSDYHQRGWNRLFISLTAWWRERLTWDRVPHSFVAHGLFGTPTHDVVKGSFEKMEDAILILEEERRGGFARWVLASKCGCNWWGYSLLRGLNGCILGRDV